MVGGEGGWEPISGSGAGMYLTGGSGCGWVGSPLVVRGVGGMPTVGSGNWWARHLTSGSHVVCDDRRQVGPRIIEVRQAKVHPRLKNKPIADGRHTPPNNGLKTCITTNYAVNQLSHRHNTAYEPRWHRGRPASRLTWSKRACGRITMTDQ